MKGSGTVWFPQAKVLAIAELWIILDGYLLCVMTRIISPVGIPEYDWLTTVKLDDFARAEVRATAPSSSGVIESNVNPLAPEPKNSTDWGETPGMYLPRFWYVLDDGPFVSMVDVMVKLPC